MKRHNQIEQLAYELYENSGFRKERDLKNWLEAERLLKLQKRLQEFKKSCFNFEKEAHQGSESTHYKWMVYK